ncbi:MAG: VanZ family protein [Planctomycetota bacterium]
MADRRLLIVRWATVLAWAALVAVLSVLPGRAFPDHGTTGVGTVGHFVVYLVLAFLAQHAARKPCLMYWVVVTVSCGLFGAALEVVQQLLPGRTMSVADGLVNFLGAAAGSAVYVLWARRRAAT